MDKYLIDGGGPLSGEITVARAKNAVLPLLAAAVMAEGSVALHKCPPIADVSNMLNILRTLNCRVTHSKDLDIVIDAGEADGEEIPADLARELRSSIFLLGPILGRFKRARAAYPGGCDIGFRPIDLHLKGLRDLNVKITEEYGGIVCDGRDMRGAEILLEIPSVGATENLMMAAALALGSSVIRNAAKEPEILDLQRLLNAMGGRVSGAGTSTIKIEGVAKLSGAEYTPMPDRIEAGTFMLACAIAGGKITLHEANCEHLFPLTAKLRDSGVKVICGENSLTVIGEGRPLSCAAMETQPYPGFPTDLQAPFLSLQAVSDGVCVIRENLFETRFKHVPELVKMGADITVRDRTAVVRGVRSLRGAQVAAHELRGGAALTIAAIAARGATVLDGVRHIERGYYRFEERLSALGVRITRI
ncbi:UDP-N-acetylglucosamine 1-carboxyvinyltransferase [Clostridia bacterium]|nr:UDP-N-acetylglucosamine 1-carboxyvinyltransferase [Clostridia bacterium]